MFYKGVIMIADHYSIIFYVPEAHCEVVKQAMFIAGAGVLGDYQECAWQVLGEGQFKPLKSSQPFLGEIGQLETVAEYKVEMICEKSKIKSVIKALQRAHPYEEPAYAVFQPLDF